MIGFQNIVWHHLWALALLPLLVLFFFLHKRRKRKRVGVPGPVDIAAYKSRRTILLPYLSIPLIAALILAIIALVNPQKPNALEKVSAEGIDIFLVMDLSYSMLEKDFEPSRIAVAKEAAVNFIKKRKHDRIGIVPFGRTAFTQCPLTMDHEVVLELLDELKVGIVGPNTAIGLGLATAVNRLKDSDAASKVIILFTDGVNNVFDVDPITAAQLAAQFDIKVYTIGMTKVFYDQRIPGGEQLEIHEDNLKEIAQLTGGQYFRATSKDALEQIYNQIDRLERTEMEVTLINRAELKYHIFLFPAFILLFLWFLASRTFLKTFLPC